MRAASRPDTVFDWAKRHSNYRDLRQVSKRLIENAVGMELLDAVLDDHPLCCFCPVHQAPAPIQSAGPRLTLFTGRTGCGGLLPPTAAARQPKRGALNFAIPETRPLAWEPRCRLVDDTNLGKYLFRGDTTAIRISDRLAVRVPRPSRRMGDPPRLWGAQRTWHAGERSADPGRLSM